MLMYWIVYANGMIYIAASKMRNVDYSSTKSAGMLIPNYWLAL